MESVVVGMSGGVDSTAAVVLLREAGYAVHGLTLWLHGSDKGAREAAETAAMLSVPHTVLDLRAEFADKVTTPFLEAYRRGLTPNPCVRCNTEIKFAALLQFADREGIEKIATGHYAGIKEVDGKYLFSTGADSKKDQTYFLSRVSPLAIPRLVLPLGAYTKDEVRSVARRAGLSAAEKADSQEICFVPDNDYIAYLEKADPSIGKEGKIVDGNGYMVGLHGGIHRYTIGQRKGLGAFGKKMFVTAIDAKQNTVTVGEGESLYSAGLFADGLNAFDDTEGEVMVKIRSAAPAVPGVCCREEEGVYITFREPQRAVTPGQTVAIYKADCLVGGATIRRSIQ